MFSLDFMFHMYFLVRYCRLLEEGSFRNRTADFVAFILFGVSLMILAAPFVSVHFLGSSLTFMMVYLWGRRNEHVRMSFLGLFPFTAPYLPWVLLTFSVVLGNSATVDLIGIVVGHLYYFLEDVYPVIADIRGWRIRRVLVTPVLLYVSILCPTFTRSMHECQYSISSYFDRKYLCNMERYVGQPTVVGNVAPENNINHALPNDDHPHQD